MGYFMRFFVTSDTALTIDAISAALRAHDSAYRVENTAIPDLCELYHGALYLGELEISRPDEEIFHEERDELKSLVALSQDANAPRVLDALENTRLIVVMDAVWQDDTEESADEVFSALDPLWDWLFVTVGGVLHFDTDGFYDADDLILEMNVRP